MKTHTTDTDEFERRWNAHIDELTGLGWNLNPDDFERVKELQSELRELVETASDQFDSE